MIIKSHIRGGYRDAAAYLKDQGENEVTRLVEMSDPHVKDLDEAFRAMWAVADGTMVKKPLHHISINPMKDERLTDKQVLRICERLEEKYGYAHGEHQRVIVEHIKEGRQHFHVIWNRVNMTTGKPHYPYMHKKQSKIAAREMEIELGLKKPTPRLKTGKARFKEKSKRQPKSRKAAFGTSSNYRKRTYRPSRSGVGTKCGKQKHHVFQQTGKAYKANRLSRPSTLLRNGKSKSSRFKPTHRSRLSRITALKERPNIWSIKPTRPFVQTGQYNYLPALPVAIKQPASSASIRFKVDQNPPTPFRPVRANMSGMCEEQRIDFLAACEGRITWQQYHQKWGNKGEMTHALH